MQRRINQKLTRDKEENAAPPHTNSTNRHFPLSSPRLAAVWNPNWESNESAQAGVEIGPEEQGAEVEEEECANNDDTIDFVPDEIDDDNEMEEQGRNYRPVRSILKNSSSVSLPIKKKSKVRGYKNGNSKSKRSLDAKREGFSRAEMINFPTSVTDIDTYRRYLSRPPSRSTGADDGDRGDETKDQFFGTRRTMAISQAIMSLALLAISASQLRFLIVYENAQVFPTLSFFLLTMCIIIEIIGGVGYLVLARFEFNEDLMDKIQSCLMFALFCAAIITIFMSSFALENHVCETFALDLAANSKEHGNGKGPSETS